METERIEPDQKTTNAVNRKTYTRNYTRAYCSGPENKLCVLEQHLNYVTEPLRTEY